MKHGSSSDTQSSPVIGSDIGVTAVQVTISWWWELSSCLTLCAFLLTQMGPVAACQLAGSQIFGSTWSDLAHKEAVKWGCKASL